MRRRDLIGSSLAWALGSSLPAAALCGPRKVRVAAVVSGDYNFYQQVLSGLVAALQARGLLECPPLRTRLDDERGINRLWRDFVVMGTGRVEALEDGLYNGHYQPERMQRLVEELRSRIAARHDVDLILSFGQIAGRYLPPAIRDVPIVLVSGAAEVRNPTKKAHPDNVFEAFEPERTESTLLMYHRLCRFRRLGVPYLNRQEPTLNFPVIRKICQSLRVPLFLRPLHCSDQPDIWFEAFFSAIREMVLVDKVDALYLPFYPSNDAQNDALVDFLAFHRVFSFSSVSDAAVRRGILLGPSPEVQLDRYAFLARAIEEIVAGRSPASIDAMLHHVPRFSVNLKMGAQIGWRPGVVSLSSFDATYSTYYRNALTD